MMGACRAYRHAVEGQPPGSFVAISIAVASLILDLASSPGLQDLIYSSQFRPIQTAKYGKEDLRKRIVSHLCPNRCFRATSMKAFVLLLHKQTIDEAALIK